MTSSAASAPDQAPQRSPRAVPHPTPARSARPGSVVFGVAAIFLALLVLFLVRGVPPEGPEPSPVLPPQEAGDVAPPETPVPSGPTAEPAAARTELTTLRRVWVRVVVDGERLLERELPAGETVPLSPRETIVLRAGDAGAVRLAIAGKDQGPLGEEGRAVTRSFDVTALR